MRGRLCSVKWAFCATAIGLLLSGCSADAEPEARSVGSPDSSTTRAPTTTTSTTTTSTTTTSTTTTTTLAPPLELDDVPRVLRTTTDVIVPVLDVVSDGHLVRTPCQAVAIVTEGETDDRVHVVLDPGHGGLEPGAVTRDGVAEKDVNLETSLLAEEYLEAAGFEVILTRYSDIRIPLRTRVEVADRLEAALLVSIHHQGTETNIPTSDEPGTEVYYQQNSDESKRFAGLLVEESRAELGQFDIEWFAGVDAGATYRPHAETGEDFYGMIRLPTTPAVLAEMAFLGNTAEVDLLKSGELQDASARAITQAIIRWFTTDDPGSGFTEPSFGLRSSGGGGGLDGCSDPDLGDTFDLAENIRAAFEEQALDDEEG